MNQVMKCNGTSYHGNAGDDTENLMKNASIRFPFSFYYNNKPENQDVDAQQNDLNNNKISDFVRSDWMSYQISDWISHPIQLPGLRKKLWCFEKHCNECNHFVEVRWPFCGGYV